MTITRSSRHSSFNPILLAAASGALAICGYGDLAAAAAPKEVAAVSLSSLGTISHITSTGRLSVLPIDSPPINGFQPQVVFGLTSEQDKNGNLGFYVAPSSTPAQQSASFTLPFAQTPKYFVATFDTGSQAHLIRYSDAQAFDIAGASREGAYQQAIGGASGEEVADITDALGIYATGFSNATVNGGGTSIGVTSGTLRGQWNCPVLVTSPESALPNLIGAPMIAQYQAVISNSQTKRMTVNGTTYSTPNVTFQTLNTAAPSNYSKLSLNVQSVNGVTPDPAYLPSLDNFNNWADNPTTPGFWASLTAQATASHTAGTSGAQDFLFDTGAEVSVVSEDTAAQVGYYTGGPNPSTPDFTVEVAGVGGTSTEVPGFYMHSLSVTTNGGPITWTNVPVLVLNIPDPRDGVGFIPGVLGMNLFTDRDLVINGGTTNPYVAIGPQILEQWNANAGGNWSDETKWTLGVPDAIGAQANFLSAIATPQTITVDGTGYTVGSLKFDNSQGYTIAGPGRLTVQVSVGQANISVASGSHTISAPMTLASSTTFDVTPAAGKLTLSNDVTASSGVGITKTGAGTLQMKNVRADSLNVSAGTLKIAAGGSANSAASASRVGALTVGLSGASLDLTNNTLIVDYAGSVGTLVGDVRSHLLNSRIMSSTSSSTTRLGYGDTAVIGAGTFGGIAADSSALVIKFTFGGDATLDGKVDILDLGRLATSWQGNNVWTGGDFNYDGHVDILDLGILAGNWQAGVGSPLGSGDDLGTALAALGLPNVSVPEPAFAAISCTFALAGLVRRRRAAL